MASLLTQLPPELEFLLPYVKDDGTYTKARWLRVPFLSRVWKIVTNNITTIDWQVPVGKERILLTSPVYADVLEVFRSWLILSTHFDVTNGRLLSPTAEYERIHVVIDWIDYFLLNADALKLREHGLQAISRNELALAYDRICSDSRTSISIYQWPSRVAEYLRQGIATLNEIDVINALEVHPFLAQDIPDVIDRVTDLNDDEVVRARVWMWRESRYRLDKRTTTGFRYAPSLNHLTKQQYAGIIGKTRSFPQIRELGLVPGYRVNFEYAKAPVLSVRDNQISRANAQSYFESLLLLNALREAGLRVAKVPRDALLGIKATLGVKQGGRFRTLPADVVFVMLRKAIEFALEHGPHLIDSFIALATAAKTEGRTVYKQAEAAGIERYLSPTTAKFGVGAWTIESCAAGSGVIDNPPPVLSGPEYFRKLRQNHGLMEMLLVLYGSIQFSVGVLSARRIGELVDLRCGRASCLDVSRTRLVFANRKSGTDGRRETIARPIPPVVVELIEIVERLQRELVKAGVISSFTKLFAQPAQRGTRVLFGLSSDQYYAAIDYFCDYIEAPLNQNGERYYPRQHQLRRFFAMLFFWASGFGGIEAVRYFLGHTNVEHAWNYITESVPGSVLRGAQVDFALDSVCKDSPESKALSDILQLHFGTRQFQIVEPDVLSDYIEDLIIEGKVKVEPQFIDGGENYRVAILVTPDGVQQ